jgi:hypothetical protein
MSGDSFAQLAYLGILIAMLATGAMALFRTNIKQSLKMVGLWIVIGAILMLAYFAYHNAAP